jgi:hypothetical protein
MRWCNASLVLYAEGDDPARYYPAEEWETPEFRRPPPPRRPRDDGIARETVIYRSPNGDQWFLIQKPGQARSPSSDVMTVTSGRNRSGYRHRQGYT